MVLGLGSACAASPSPPAEPVTAVTFNVAGKSDPELANELLSLRPDFVALQESDGALVEQMPTHEMVDEIERVGIAYLADRWRVIYDGVITFGDHDRWGPRVARWARMSELGTGAEVVVYSTHLCVPIRAPDDPCDTDRQLAHARLLVTHMRSHDAPIVLGGDLNVFDGFEDGPVVRYLASNGFVDTLRAVSDDDVTTFEGNSWAPAGRIDYVFASQPVLVLDASVVAESLSDHRPVIATLQF